MVVSGFAQIQAQLQYRASGCSIGLPVVVGTSRGGGGQGGRKIAPRHGFKTGYHASGRVAAVRCNGLGSPAPGSLVLHAEHVSMEFVVQANSKACVKRPSVLFSNPSVPGGGHVAYREDSSEYDHGAGLSP